MKLHDVRTPAFIVNLPQFEANCRVARAIADRLGVRLRPHVKTHKTVEGARLQLGARDGPVTVSTPAEAAFFADAGFTDLTYAVPPTPEKLRELAELSRRVERLFLVMDQPELLPHVESAASLWGRPLDIFLKVDCGNRRVGIAPDRSDALEAARRFADHRSVKLHGLLTHAGQAYQARTVEEKRHVASWEAECLVRFAERLKREGIACREISVGSTPTLINAPHSLPGVTEIRPGNYVFFDGMQLDLGNCTEEQVAGFVLASVIAVYPAEGRAVLDAGAIALSKDAAVGAPPIYARVRGRPGLRVTGVSQEHGIVTAATADDVSRLHVGDRLQLIPHHSCLAAAAFPHYYVFEGDRVVDRWVPVRGW
jgi:D-serine deaminase-like pyridoxal phosphate-dependent protein